MHPGTLMDAKARRLAEQWPKRHTHAVGFSAGGEVVLTQDSWKRLPVRYTHTDDFCTQEARDCPCGSTLVVMVEIHDLSAE